MNEVYCAMMRINALLALKWMSILDDYRFIDVKATQPQGGMRPQQRGNGFIGPVRPVPSDNYIGPVRMPSLDLPIMKPGDSGSRQLQMNSEFSAI